MLAARAGNVSLVGQLLARGANPGLTDDYGHDAWMGALNRAIDDHAFACAHIPALFEVLGPATIDVQAGGRLIRLERGQGEFWPLGIMLAGLKTHCSGLVVRKLGGHRYERGVFADALLETLSCLPEHLWPKPRRRKEYLNSVLARAETGSAYKPARKLWQRLEKGYYMPSSDMKLRRTTPEGEVWTGIAEALNLKSVSEGSTHWLFDMYGISPERLGN
jgi:hypothetical protein